MSEQSAEASTSGERKRLPSGATLYAAVVVAGLLLFASVTKAIWPNPKHVIGEDLLGGALATFKYDYLIAAAELAMALVLLKVHRSKLAWLAVAALFLSFAGFAAHAAIGGYSCGCFGSKIEMPRGLSLAMDGVVAIGALVIAKLRSTSTMLLSTAILLGAIGGGVGWMYAEANVTKDDTDFKKQQIREIEKLRKTDPEAAEAKIVYASNVEELLASDLLRDVREAPAEGLPWYIFVWDYDCWHCQDMLPVVQSEMNSPDAPFRIKTVEIHEIKEKVGITHDFWETPTVFFVQNGELLRTDDGKPRRLEGDEAPFPDYEFFAEFSGWPQE